VLAAEKVARWDITGTCALIEAITEESVTAVLPRLRRRIGPVMQERQAEASCRYPDDHVPGF
jgi:hypothetical protein